MEDIVKYGNTYKNTREERCSKKKKSNLINRLVWIISGVWNDNLYNEDEAFDILEKLNRNFTYKNNSLFTLDKENENEE